MPTNRTRADLPATVEKAMELCLPLTPREAAKMTEALEISAGDIGRHVGVYRNGSQRLEIVAKDGRLFLKSAGGSEMVLVKHSETRYGTAGAGPTEFVLLAGDDGKTEYVHSGSRSFARVR